MKKFYTLLIEICAPKGIRTPVADKKGRCPKPLDDRSVINLTFKDHEINNY